jgi:hypothetical protein
MYEHELDVKIPKFQAKIEGHIEIVETLEELAKYKEHFTPAKYAENLDRISRYKDKMICFFHGDKLAGWGFFTVSRRSYFEPERRQTIAIPENASFLYDANTLPGFRRKGVYAARMSSLPTILKSYNKNKLFYMVYTFNKPSIENARKFGFILKKKFCYLNFGLIHLVIRIK